MYTMFLDDIRTPKEKYDVIVRSYHEATFYIKKYGMPKFISFDHDLGCDKNGVILESGHDFAKWLITIDIENKYKLPLNFDFNVHSANPIGKYNIETILNNYLKFKEVILDEKIDEKESE